MPPEGTTPRPAASEARPAGRPAPPPLPGSPKPPQAQGSLSDVQGLQKAPPKRVAPPADFSAPPAGDDVTIRTMKGDLASAPQPTVATPVPPQTKKPAPTFPLPPTQKQLDTTGPKTPLPPQQNTSSTTLIILGIIVLISVLAAGGVVGWFYFDQAPTPAQEAERATPSDSPVLAEMIPSATDALVTFSFAQADKRAGLLSTWGIGAEGTTAAEIVAGDPRPLFENPDITQVTYVFLPSGVDPYLITPDTGTSRALFQNSPGVFSIEERGWLVVHPTDTSSYISAVAEGSLAQAGRGALLASTQPATVGVSVGAATLTTARGQFGELVRTTNQLQSLELAGNPGTTPGSFTLTGATALLTPPDTSLADQQLLSLVPDTATLVELGGNFSERASQWIGTDTDTPATSAALLGQLTLPYALYLHDESSLGMIVQFPTNRPPLLDNIEIEQLLEFIVPLIGGPPTSTPREYNATTHAEIPLRYANLKGTTSALDYAVIEPYLLVATSKDAMTALLDTVTSARESVATGSAWRDVLAAWGAPPAGPRLLLGRGGLPFLDRLLPGASTRTSFGLTFSPSNETSMAVSGVATLSKGNPLTPDAASQP